MKGAKSTPPVGSWVTSDECCFRIPARLRKYIRSKSTFVSRRHLHHSTQQKSQACVIGNWTETRSQHTIEKSRKEHTLYEHGAAIKNLASTPEGTTQQFHASSPYGLSHAVASHPKAVRLHYVLLLEAVVAKGAAVDLQG